MEKKSGDIVDHKDNPTSSNQNSVSENEMLEKTNDERQVETYLVIPPDGGWGWVVVFGAFVSFFVSDGLIYGFGVFLTDMSENLNCLTSHIAMTGAIMTGFFCLAGPFIAAIVNKFGYCKIAIIGSLLAGLSCILTSLVTSHVQTYATHGLLGGLGFGMMYVPAMIALGFYFEKWRALATGIAVCGSAVGGVILPPVMATVIKRFGWRNAFRMMGALSSACAICGSLYRPLKPTKFRKVIDVALSPPSKTDSQDKSGTTVEKQQQQQQRRSNNNYFTGFHNASYPTIAEVYLKSRPVLSKGRVSLPEGSLPQKDAYSTVTIYRTEQHKLAVDCEEVSSEFVMMETTPSSVTNYSRVTTTRPDMGDSKLSTIFEEVRPKKGTCGWWQLCYRKKRRGRNDDYDDEEEEEELENERFSFNYIRRRLGACFTTASNSNNVMDSNDEQVVSRPLYRDDIFYSGSMLLIPEYRRSMLLASRSSTTPKDVLSAISSKTSVEYGMRVTRTVTARDISAGVEKPTTTSCGGVKCSEPILRTLATMLNFGLLKSRVFALLTLHAVFISLGFYTPYLFIRDKALLCGISEEGSLWLMSTLGITNTLGRVICGIVSSFSEIRSVTITFVSLLAAGIVTMLSGYWSSVWMQFAYAAVYGSSTACMASLRTVIVVELLGLENLTNAIGLMLLFQGMATLSGTAFAGFLRDWTGDYEASFYFSGGCITTGALFLLPLKKMKRETSKSAVAP